MEIIQAIDIETEIRQHLPADYLDLTGRTITVLNERPLEFPARLVIAERVGGVFRDKVTDVPMVSFDCYAPTEDEAYTEATTLAAVIRSLEGVWLGDAYVYETSIITEPYKNRDPQRPTAARYSFIATLAVRALVAQT